MKERLFVAALYGLSAALAALQASGIPHTPEAWMGIGGVFVTAFWGKFSSNTTWLSPSRAIWPDEKRNGGASPVPPPGP